MVTCRVGGRWPLSALITHSRFYDADGDSCRAANTVIIFPRRGRREGCRGACRGTKPVSEISRYDYAEMSKYGSICAPTICGVRRKLEALTQAGRSGNVTPSSLGRLGR